MQKIAMWLCAVILVLVAVVAAAIVWGRPKSIAAKESINAPFKNVDYRALPPHWPPSSRPAFNPALPASAL